VSHQDLYLTHLEPIERVIKFVIRRNRLSETDAEDFASTVRVRLIEDDYRILRSFQHRSSIHTFLTTVVQRVFIDWQRSRWGKWRPSAEARRSGPTAILVEQLLVRDGLSVDETFEVLRTNHQFTGSRDEVNALAARFPCRPRRQFVNDEALTDVPAATDDPEHLLRIKEYQREADRTIKALEQATEGLAPRDRLLMKMQFEDGLTVAEIARALSLDQKALYRHLENLRRSLKRELQLAGVGPEAAHRMGE